MHCSKHCKGTTVRCMGDFFRYKKALVKPIWGLLDIVWWLVMNGVISFSDVDVVRTSLGRPECDNWWLSKMSLQEKSTHSGQDKMVASLKTIFFKYVLLNEIITFWLEFQLSLFPRVQLIISQNWFTHWGRDKMATVSQTTLSNAFSWMKMLWFRLKFHWSLFLRFELTIFQHCFR